MSRCVVCGCTDAETCPGGAPLEKITWKLERPDLGIGLCSECVDKDGALLRWAVYLSEALKREAANEKTDGRDPGDSPRTPAVKKSRWPANRELFGSKP